MFEKSIELLNKAVADELAAVHQYMYFHFQCDDQGLDLLAALFRNTAIQEMMHIERLAERILFLKGDVDLKAAEEVRQIHDVREMIEFGAESEFAAIKTYNQAANECAANADSVSKKLFEDLVAEEEAHFDKFDTERDNLKNYGDSYLALQSIERSKSAAGGSAGAE